MKKITLFLVAIFAMINVANAQRAWAYDLELTPSVDSYTFAFKAVTAGDATLVFYKEGVEAGTLNLGSVSAGDNTVTKTSEELLAAIQQSGDFTWGVKMSAGAIALNGNYTKEVTDGSKSIYKFYLPQGVVVDNNPESETFGTFFIAAATDGQTDGSSERADGQKRGVFVYDQTLSELNPTSNVGIIPSNVTLSDASRQAMHRIAVNPVNNQVAFAYNVSGSPAVWSVPANNPAGEATNLIAGTSITMPNSICFDENGALYVMDNANATTGGTLYKVVDGIATKIAQNTTWQNIDNSLAYDGRGGLWIAQSHDGNTWPSYEILSHVNSTGIIDWRSSDYKTSSLFSNGNSAGFSKRGQCAYSPKDDLLAFGGNKRCHIFQVTYDINGVPSLGTTYKYRTPFLSATNVDGLAFDYAGDLYLMSASAERFYKYAIPTTNNTCTVPAKKSQVITLVSATPEHTVTINVNGNGNVTGANTGTYLEGTELTLTATPAEHHDFINWTGDITSTDNPLTITVNSDINITANFQEHTKYTITASAADNTMGYVTGGGTYYAGETVTLTAVAKSTYYFVNWSDANTNATRTFNATENVTLTANFAKANPRAWAYDLKMVEEGDNYKFSFTATTAANATLLFLDKEGNELYPAHNIGAVAAGANTVSIEKAYFTQVKDVYWSVKMDGEAITAVAEITDQSRGIYDFYSTLGVTVDNNPNSEYFGKVYVQATLDGASDGATARAKEQTAGLFIYNQLLDELNPTSNVGIQPSLPSGYSIGGTYQFNRLAIDPTTNNITYCYAISGKPAVFSMDRANLTGTPANLLAGQSDITRSVAHCFDTDGALYVMDLPGSGQIFKIDKNGTNSTFGASTSQYVQVNTSLASDGRGGLWVSQNRGQIDDYYQLVHYNELGTVDFAVYKGNENGFTGSSTRGALAYDAERHILAQGRNSTVEVFQVAYDATTGVPTLTKIATTPQVNKANIDGLAFDYAGDLYMVNSGTEKFYKYTLPTAENICTVPAPKSQAIVKEIRHTVTTNTIGNGTVIGAGEYVEGETASLKATPAAHHQFVNWTFDDETTSTDNPLELVVNSDIIVTANFKPIQYTLIAPTNDENKGTVTGAGTYSYGTEVTLTATPKVGYKLLYWSDRSTENPRTITMNKNEALSAYFVKEYDEEPTFTITKLWENTNVPASTNNGFQAIGWDQKIYMKDRLNAVIDVYTATSSTLYTQLGSAVIGLAGDQPIAVDDAGNIVVRSGSAFFYDAPTQVTILRKGETIGKTIDFTLPATGRCDFISASGDIYSAGGGYVYFYCLDQTTVSRLYIKNGGATIDDISVDKLDVILTNGSSQSHVFKNIFGGLMTHTRASVKVLQEVNVLTGVVTTMNLPNFKVSTLGGCSFELGGKELIAYNIAGTDYNSEWNIYNMTDKQFLSNETLYAKDKVSRKNSGASNWLNVQVVDENTAYIYQFCPEVAVAVWKVSLVRNDLENFTITATANNALMGSIVGSGEYYEGGTAMLTANANPGFRFVNWTKGGVEVSTDATYLFTVTEDVELVANFEVILLDTENNKGILTNLNDQTVDVAVYRNLTAGMYNTLCLPFDVDDILGTPLENTTVWQYNGAEVKVEGDSKEIFLEFTDVTSLKAGQPYLVEPAAEIEAPMVFNGVTISAINGSEVAKSAVTMHGILHPTELQANNKSILFLVENNNLAWANETANMNGMRAYFKVNEPSLLTARTRAYIRKEPTVATDMENITTSETEIKKVIYNGSLYIIRGDEVYTIQGTKVK